MYETRLVWVVRRGEVIAAKDSKGSRSGDVWIGVKSSGEWTVYSRAKHQTYSSEEVAIAAAVMLTSLDNNT